MPTPPTDAEYRDYYRRLLRQFSKDLFRLGGGQVLGAILATAILAFQYSYGLIPSNHGWKEIKSIGWPYAVLVGILFLLSALRAPVELGSESQRQIRELSEKLEFPDKALSEHLRELLGRVGDNGKRVMQFVLWHGETTAMRIKIHNMTEKEIYEGIQLCVSENLLKFRSEPPITSGFATHFVTGVLRTTYYFVPDELRDTLKLLLAG